MTSLLKKSFIICFITCGVSVIASDFSEFKNLIDDAFYQSDEETVTQAQGVNNQALVIDEKEMYSIQEGMHSPDFSVSPLDEPSIQGIITPSTQDVIATSAESNTTSLPVKGLMTGALAQAAQVCKQVKSHTVDPICNQYKMLEKKWHDQSIQNKMLVVSGVVVIAGVTYAVIKEVDLYVKRKQLIAQIREDVCYLVQSQTQPMSDIAYMQLIYTDLQQKAIQTKTAYRTVNYVYDRAVFVNEIVTIYTQQAEEALEFWVLDDRGAEYLLISL